MLASLNFLRAPLHFSGVDEIMTQANLNSYGHMPERFIGCVSLTLPQRVVHDRRFLELHLPSDIRFVGWLQGDNRMLACAVDIPAETIASCELLPYRVMPDCVYHDIYVRIETLGMAFTRSLVAPLGKNVSEYLRGVLPVGWELMSYDNTYRFKARISL